MQENEGVTDRIYVFVCAQTSHRPQQRIEREQLASLLDEARLMGEVRIKRRDGREFVVHPVTRTSSPLDIQGVELNWTREEIVEAVRAGRERSDY